MCTIDKHFVLYLIHPDPTSFMATMASTSHSLSVFANTCIKNPLNPITGLSTSLKERTVVKFVNDTNKSLDFCNDNAQNRDWTRSNGQSSLSIEDLQAAKEEEFYEKLLQLKSENERTMQAYERLYKEKLLLEGIHTVKADKSHLDKSGVDREVESGTKKLVVNGTGQVNIPDKIAALSSSLSKKPPVGKNKANPVLSKSGPQESVQRIRNRPSSAPTNRRSNSFDEAQWRHILRNSQEEDPDNYIVISNEALNNDYERNIAKINSMWDDFEINPAPQRRHSFSLSQTRKKPDQSVEDKKAKTMEWKHRITIPKPFNMSVREALKEKKKTSAQMELEERRKAKEREEEVECEKKFKAQPAPSHIYIPLYDEITEKQESRRKFVRQYCQEMLLSKVKPFNFEMREKDKLQQKTLNAQPVREKKPKPGFKAAPVPRHIFNPNIDDKFLEDEELRKIRIKMRSKELLRESSLPPNMAAREQLKEQERKEKARKAKSAQKQKQRPRSAHAVPDYDALYREFQKEMARSKVLKEGTAVEPFDLETNHLRSSRDRIRRDIEMDEKRLKENRWPFRGSRESPRSSMKYLGNLIVYLLFYFFVCLFFPLICFYCCCNCTKTYIKLYLN